MDSLAAYDSMYPKAGGVVDGRQVRPDVPNLSSIGASLLDYEILRGTREVSMSHFGGPESVFYSAGDFKRSQLLAQQLAASKSINPLIIVHDKDGPYILEGAHRYVALHHLGAKSFPAVVVIDMESMESVQAPQPAQPNATAWVRANCKFAKSVV